MNTDKIIYYGLLVVCVVLALLLEFVPQIDGVLPSDGAAAIYTEYALALLTLGGVYLSLRLIKKKAVTRAVVLAILMVANIICYHIFMVPSFFYLSLIALAGYPFVYPSLTPSPSPKGEGSKVEN